MSIQTYAEINSSNAVINLVQWDGVTPFNVAPNTLVATNGNVNAQIGGTYVGGVFTAPVPGAPAQGIVQLVQPTTGSTVQIANAPQPQAKLFLVIQAAGSLANLSLQFPQAPLDGDTLNVSTKFSVAALADVANLNQTIGTFPAALAAGSLLQWVWSAQYSLWIRTQ